jgi:hypothetical protein
MSLAKIITWSSLPSGPKRKEVIGYWRKSRIEELHDLYISPGISSRSGSSIRAPDY